MLDVLHYFFEQDNEYVSELEAEHRSNIRTNIYRLLYDIEYKYPIRKSNESNFDPDSDEDFSNITPVDPTAMGVTKPYIPATDVDDLGSILDGPLG